VLLSGQSSFGPMDGVSAGVEHRGCTSAYKRSGSDLPGSEVLHLVAVTLNPLPILLFVR